MGARRTIANSFSTVATPAVLPTSMGQPCRRTRIAARRLRQQLSQHAMCAAAPILPGSCCVATLRPAEERACACVHTLTPHIVCLKLSAPVSLSRCKALALLWNGVSRQALDVRALQGHPEATTRSTERLEFRDAGCPTAGQQGGAAAESRRSRLLGTDRLLVYNIMSDLYGGVESPVVILFSTSECLVWPGVTCLVSCAQVHLC